MKKGGVMLLLAFSLSVSGFSNNIGYTSTVVSAAEKKK